MGTASRSKPKRLADKLFQIRQALRLSQNGLISRLGLTDKLSQYNISVFERGVREPPLEVLLLYARAVGVWVDVLIDDELDLPAKLPSTRKSEGVARKAASRKSAKR